MASPEPSRRRYPILDSLKMSGSTVSQGTLGSCIPLAAAIREGRTGGV
jgi:hypothetical protein